MGILQKVGFYSLLMLLALSGCDHRPNPISHNPAHDAYISAHTTGEISKKSPIVLEFADEVVKNTAEAIPKGLFSISPNIEGNLSWQDKRSLLFVPNHSFVSGEIYTATVQLDKVLANIPAELATFKFQFRAKPQFVNVSPLAATVSGEKGELMRLQGKLSTRDAENIEAIEQIFTAFVGNKNLKINWEHLDNFTHIFTIDSVSKQEQRSQVLWKWNGKAIQTNNSGELNFPIPSNGEFILNNSYKFQNPEQHIVLEFSEQLDPNQSLDGLIKLGGKPLKFAMSGNQIKVYTQNKLKGSYKLEILAGIKGLSGKILAEPQTEDINFSDAKPELKWIGKGNIIPRSNTMPIIFQTVNLSAIDIRVIKIKETNVVQFFQVNKIDGNQELKRVGTEVLRKKIDFSNNKELNLGDWTTHSLDLATLLEPEQGAIYEIAIGFRKSYSLYSCTTNRDVDGNELKDEEKDMLALGADWDKPTLDDSYWDYYEEDYEYEDLQNPCAKYYYNSDKSIRRNVLGSDLGIMAKRGDNGNLFVVNNLQTTEPMSGVDLELYDFHHNVIANFKTDASGFAKIDIANLSNPKPFLLVAKSGKQRGYLRLDDGASLSMSRFDVQGAKYEKGLKGFIYGERGVWRPGDELFLNFILEDKDKTLPANHPVLFELKDSKGGLVAKKTATNGVNGFYNFTCRTDENAVTGNYTATIKVGGATFTKTVKIEAIKPNRLKLNLDFGTTTALNATNMGKTTLKASWLTGAVARNLKTEVQMGLKASSPKFEKFIGFEFSDLARELDTENQVVFEGKLNENGEANFTPKINLKNIQAPSVLTANFITQVYEEGGDFSIDQFSVPFHAYNNYVGISIPKGDEKRDMLLTDIKHNIQIATVDINGNPVDKSKIDVTLYKLDWRWWFEQSKNEVSAYQGKVSAQEIQKGSISTKNGVGSWQMEVKYPDWGRYLVRACDGTGHCASKVVYIDWPGWAGRSNEKDPEGATALNFTADKTKYNVGETVTLNIPTGFAGRALVSIENNSKILAAQWINATKGTTTFTFTATKEMSPNVYAHVTLLQPHAQTKNDLPIRMYGIIPIQIEDPNTRLNPTIDIAAELEPLKDFTVNVAERNGGAMSYTVAIVDEGLLDITKFKTPSPWETFYQRMALGVKTWDMYNEVLGAYGGQVKSLLAIGGDDAVINNAAKKQDRFKPVVLYAGPFSLAKGEKKAHTFKMPNYVGSVRVMVIAGQDGSYGSAEKTAPVKQPLMVLATLPRVIAPDEKIQLPVNVFAMKEGISNVEISVQTNDFFEISDNGKKTIPIQSMSDAMAYFELKAKSKVGIGSVKVMVKSGNFQSYYETEIQVRNPNPAIANISPATTLEDKQIWTQSYNPNGIAGTNSATLEVSAIPAINLQSRLKYLVKYPYGCVEQTTSSAFPQLFVGQFLELKDEMKADIDKNVKAAINKLQKFQTSSGGFLYWTGANGADNWATSYVGHFLILAQKSGYSLPSGMLDKFIEHQTSTAAAYNPSNASTDKYTAYANDLSQTYRLFTLALAGRPEMGAMNRFRTSRSNNLDINSRYYLAAAYSLAGQKDVAKTITVGAILDVAAIKSNEAARTYGSQYRDQALLLYTLSLLDERAQASNLVKAVASKLGSTDWLSTQETAFGLIAMAQYTNKESNTNFAFEYKIGDGSWVKVASGKPIFQTPLDGEKSAKIEVKNMAGAALYPRLIGEGVPAAGNETEASNGISLTVKYLDQNGKDLNVKSIAQSTNFIAVATIKNTSGNDLSELALNQIFPSGWEILNMRLLNTSVAGGDTPDFQDQRDDRVYTFFDLKKGESKIFKLALNATYWGRYYLPSATVECMYDKTYQARLKGDWVEVVKK